MATILCIDDNPKELLPNANGKSLKDVLNAIYKNKYKIIFRMNGKDGIKRASSKNKDIKLILLDIDFKGKYDGPEIANKLFEQAPWAKVIVLTRIDDRGEKIRFGFKENVVHYVVKRKLPDIQSKLKNLSQAIIKDYGNQNWEIEYDETARAIHLTRNSKTYSVDIPPSMQKVIELVTRKPNECVTNPGGSTPGAGVQASLNKVINSINNKVLEKTNWNMWGILTQEGCARGQLKLVIGSVKKNVSSQTNIPNLYVTQSQFDKFKKDVLGEIDSIKRELQLLKSNKT